MEAIPVMNKSSLVILNEALLKAGLKEADEMIGKKYCFSSMEDSVGEFSKRIIVGTIAEVNLENNELSVIPNSPPDPTYQLVSFRWITWDGAEPYWVAQFFGPFHSDDGDTPGYGSQEGVFYLLV